MSPRTSSRLSISALTPPTEDTRPRGREPPERCDGLFGSILLDEADNRVDRDDETYE